MAKLRSLTDSTVQRSKQQVRTYGTKTDLASTVVERGSTHWAEGSNVNIDGFLGVAGTMTVSGVLSVTGTFNASGDINLSGSTSVTGPLDITGATTIGGSLDVTGPTNLDGLLTINGDTTITGLLNITGDTTITGLLAVDGPTTISGTLDIEGATTVGADFEIIAGGLFKSGVTKIEPTGKATFGSFIIDPASNKLIQSPGGWLFSDGSDSIGLAGSSTSSVNLNSARAELVYGGSSRVVARPSAIDLTAAKTTASGELEVAGTVRFQAQSFYLPSLPPTSNPPNIHRGADGRLYASSWTPA